MRRGRKKLDWTLVMRKELQHWRRRPDRLKATWSTITHEESWVESYGDCWDIAPNRGEWKQNVKVLCALWHGEI